MRTERPQLLPWQEPVWKRLASMLHSGRTGHAMLLAGPPDIGKHRLARVLGMALLCARNQADGTACGQCPSCIQLVADTHPDLARLAPSGGGDVIAIDAVRDLCRQLQLTSHHGRGRICIIDRCERMTAAAANSLLKTLEEPPVDSRLILVTSRPMGLAATIRSRCRLLRLPLPDPIAVKRWLGEQHVDSETAATLTQRPLLVLRQNAASTAAPQPYVEQAVAVAQCRGDASETAEKWAGAAPESGAEAVYFCLLDMLRLRAGASAEALTNAAHAEALGQLSKRVSGQRLNALADNVIHARSLAGTQINQQLLMESLLIQWQSSCADCSHTRSVQ